MLYIVWLIEDKLAGSARWWCGGNRFDTDANEAIHFIRKEDADRVILTTLNYIEFPLIATEHCWSDE